MQETYGAVLAAGLGTRLRPLTERLPKPLVPIGGRPLIERALDALAGAGVEHIGVNAWHCGEALPRGLGHRSERLEIVHEETLQGTGGGLRGIAARLPRGPIVCINGDALFDFDLAGMLEAHQRSGAMASLVLREVSPQSPFARIGVDAEGCVQRIAEVQGPGADADLHMAAYTGVQILQPELLDALPEGPSDVLRTAYRQRMGEGARIGALFAPKDCLWIDVGTPARYLDAHRAILSGRLSGFRGVHPEARVDAKARIGPRCAVEAGASIGADARLDEWVHVGRGATVKPGTTLRNCVVWAGAVAEGQLSDQVVLE